MPFDTLFRPGPKPFDFAFEEATITPQRQKVVDFSSSYFDANQGVLLNKDATAPKSLADLKKMTLCTQTATTGLDYVQHQLKRDEASQIYTTTSAAFSAVQVGRCNAFVMDVPIVASQKKSKPSAYGAVAGQIVTNEKYGAVLAKDSKLTPLVSKAIDAAERRRHDREAAEEVVPPRRVEGARPEVATRTRMHEVLRAFFDPTYFRQALPDVWAGFVINLKMMLIAEALVLVFALVIAIVRGLPGRGARPFRGLAILYTDFFRGTPLTIVAFVFILGIPGLRIHTISNQSNMVYGIAALTVVYTAYVTEVYRAGIESVHGSQRMAARSLGLSYGQALRFVVLPQAIRRVIPPLLNDFIGLQKDTAIIGAIGVTEAAAQATNFANTLLQLHRLLRRRLLLRLPHDPARALHRQPDRERERRERAAAV